MSRKLGAEFVGTFLLVFLAVGAAVFGIAGGVGFDKSGPGSGVVGVAFAFGLVVLMLAYAFGPVSGTHVNPAVTLGMVLAKRMPGREGGGYVVAQFAGAILGGAMLKLFVSSFGVTDQTGALGTNGYDNGAINMPGAFVLEAVLTAAFVLVILLVTEKVATPALAGLAIGLALTAVHLVGIPLTGTSVNPARSFGPALFEGGTALSQVWLFILAPLVGAVLAVGVWKLTRVEDAPEVMELRGDMDSSASRRAAGTRLIPIRTHRMMPAPGLRWRAACASGPRRAGGGSWPAIRRSATISPWSSPDQAGTSTSSGSPTLSPPGRTADADGWARSWCPTTGSWPRGTTVPPRAAPPAWPASAPGACSIRPLSPPAAPTTPEPVPAWLCTPSRTACCTPTAVGPSRPPSTSPTNRAMAAAG